VLTVMNATGQLYRFRIRVDIHHRVTENTELYLNLSLRVLRASVVKLMVPASPGWGAIEFGSTNAEFGRGEKRAESKRECSWEGGKLRSGEAKELKSQSSKKVQ